MNKQRIQNKLVWDSPRRKSMGSMPFGGGSIGCNIWVEGACGAVSFRLFGEGGGVITASHQNGKVFYALTDCTRPVILPKWAKLAERV